MHEAGQRECSDTLRYLPPCTELPVCSVSLLRREMLQRSLWVFKARILKNLSGCFAFPQFCRTDVTGASSSIWMGEQPTTLKCMLSCCKIPYGNKPMYSVRHVSVIWGARGDMEIPPATAGRRGFQVCLTCESTFRTPLDSLH